MKSQDLIQKVVKISLKVLSKALKIYLYFQTLALKIKLVAVRSTMQVEKEFPAQQAKEIQGNKTLKILKSIWHRKSANKRMKRRKRPKIVSKRDRKFNSSLKEYN